MFVGYEAFAPSSPTGLGEYGQLGRNSTNDSWVAVTVTVPAGVSGWTAVSAGKSHSCAVAAGWGDLYCWGEAGVVGRLGRAVACGLR